jgi:hypothetical protein
MSQTAPAPSRQFRGEGYAELAKAFNRLQEILKKQDAGLWSGWLESPTEEEKATAVTPVEAVPVQVTVEVRRLTPDDTRAWVKHLILGCQGWLRLPSEVVLGPIGGVDQLASVGLGGQFSLLQGEWCVEGHQSVAMRLEKPDTWIATTITESPEGAKPRRGEPVGGGELVSQVSFPALAVTECVHGLIRRAESGNVPGLHRYRIYWAAESEVVGAASPSGLQRIAACLGLARPNATVPESELRRVAVRFAGFADEEGGTS